MKRTLLPILVVGLLLLGACGANPNKHYVNEEFGYSIDYPKDWTIEELNPNEIAIMPEDSSYNQIRISAYIAEPVIASMPESWVVTAKEAELQQFFDTLGATDLIISFNKPALENWDWIVIFLVLYEDIPLQGVQLTKETDSVSYTLLNIQYRDWPEGQEVIDSFKLTE